MTQTLWRFLVLPARFDPERAGKLVLVPCLFDCDGPDVHAGNALWILRVCCPVRVLREALRVLMLRATARHSIALVLANV